MRNIPSNFDKSPFLNISLGDKTSIVKKSSLCWLLDEKNEKVSTDRLFRFIRNSKPSSKRLEKNEEKRGNAKVTLPRNSKKRKRSK
jgi:hypothetical protein